MSLTRRRVLFALGATLVGAPAAGCTLFDRDSAHPRASPPPPPPDPAAPLLAAESMVLALYDATAALYPQLAAQIGPIRSDHAAHVEALRAILRNPAANASPTPPASPSARPIVAGTAAAAVLALRSAEASGGRLLTAACLDSPQSHVALFGSIAACEAGHLVLLG